jgi:hypothetical protein
MWHLSTRISRRCSGVFRSCRCVAGVGSFTPDYTTQAVSIFQNGFVIVSPEKLKIGSLLSLRLRVPPEVSGGPFWESRCADARVVTEQLLKGGELGYGVTIKDDALR